MRKVWILGLAGLVLQGCGGAAGNDRTGAASAPSVKHTVLAAAKPEPRTLIVFRRIRYEGATIKILDVRADGSLKLKVPNGGAGGANFDGRLTPRALSGVRRAIARTPWSRLSKKRVLLDRSGAYYMLHRDGKDYVAMADGMSTDLLPIVRRLGGVLNGDGMRHDWHVVHRFGRI